MNWRELARRLFRLRQWAWRAYITSLLLCIPAVLGLILFCQFAPGALAGRGVALTVGLCIIVLSLGVFLLGLLALAAGSGAQLLRAIQGGRKRPASVASLAIYVGLAFLWIGGALMLIRWLGRVDISSGNLPNSR